MQPVGSGYNVWLNEQVLTIFGPIEGQQLIDASSTHKAHRYTWLLSVLAERGHQDVVDDYHCIKKSAESERRIDERRRSINLMQKQFDNDDGTMHPQRATYLRKEMAKCQKYIDERIGK